MQLQMVFRQGGAIGVQLLLSQGGKELRQKRREPNVPSFRCECQTSRACDPGPAPEMWTIGPQRKELDSLPAGGKDICGLFLDSPRGPGVGRHRQLWATVAQYLPKVGRDAVAAVGDGNSRFSTGRLCERAQRDSSFAAAALLGTLPCCGSKGASLCALCVSLLAETALPDPAGLQCTTTGGASTHARGTGLCLRIRPGGPRPAGDPHLCCRGSGAEGSLDEFEKAG
mmetsp:Transcript_55295/g.87799  ORF Transcript_55295/g.87799 Transcript_55295/m.87799 type:complete len:227 (+) Transcript_55295:1168-1848(+)